MRVWISPSRGQVVVTLRGELDLATGPVLDRTIERALDEAPEATSLVLDLTDVTFIDSSGVKTLIRARRQLRGRDPVAGQLVVCNVQPPVHRILGLLGIGSLAAVHPLPEDLPPTTQITLDPPVTRKV